MTLALGLQDFIMEGVGAAGAGALQRVAWKTQTTGMVVTGLATVAGIVGPNFVRDPMLRRIIKGI